MPEAICSNPRCASWDCANPIHKEESMTRRLERTEVAEMFRQADAEGKVALYNKFGTVQARLAQEGEVVNTVINGVQETTNTASAGDVVIKNIGSASQEEYIIDGGKFAKRYTTKGDLGENFIDAEPVGSTYAFTYQGEGFTFTAPWGEDMVVENGDAICAPSKDDLNDVYRIEAGAFVATYAAA